MKIYFKTSAIIILSLLFTNCRKESTSYLQRAYEEAVKLHQEGNLNDAVFYYQLTALNCQYHPEDSLTYWWKAMCGQGEVWRQKNFLDRAQTDFETVLQNAPKYRLDTAEYIASRKLTLSPWNNNTMTSLFLRHACLENGCKKAISPRR